MCGRDLAARCAPELCFSPPVRMEGDGAPDGAPWSWRASTQTSLRSLRKPDAEAQRLPARRHGVLQPRAALLLGPVGFRRSALSQPAPGGRLVRPPSGAPRLPRTCLRGTPAGAAPHPAERTPLEAPLRWVSLNMYIFLYMKKSRKLLSRPIEKFGGNYIERQASVMPAARPLPHDKIGPATGGGNGGACAATHASGRKSGRLRGFAATKLIPISKYRSGHPHVAARNLGTDAYKGKRTRFEALKFEVHDKRFTLLASGRLHEILSSQVSENSGGVSAAPRRIRRLIFCFGPSERELLPGIGKMKHGRLLLGVFHLRGHLQAFER
jgi:hypothetical protein